MNAGEKHHQPSPPPSVSPLDKPLAELTEEDIAQLTREDCRRFLKDKGMRRPSWNKSQAIQQVISLKALLEGRPGGGDCPAGPGIFQKPPPAEAATAASASPGNSSQIAAASPAEEVGGREPQETCPYRRRDPLPPSAVLFAGGEASGGRIPVVGKDGQPPDNRRQLRAVAGGPAGQMTIFYDGRVNVYEGVTPEQARLIMEMAASPEWSEDEEQAVAVPYRPPVPHFCQPGALAAPQLAGVPPSRATAKLPHRIMNSQDEGKSESEGPTTRKASVQRYLEKRKDRFKGKKFVVGSANSSMDVIYLSQKFRCHNPNESTIGVDRSSNLPQSPGTPASCNSIENQSQTVRLSIDLNGDGCGN